MEILHIIYYEKMKRPQEDLVEFYSYLNFIKNNLFLSSTEIIKGILKKHNLSRTTLDRKLKNYIHLTIGIQRYYLLT